MIYYVYRKETRTALSLGAWLNKISLKYRRRSGKIKILQKYFKKSLDKSHKL
jgi:hypothetical protein